LLLAFSRKCENIFSHPSIISRLIITPRHPHASQTFTALFRQNLVFLLRKETPVVAEVALMATEGVKPDFQFSRLEVRFLSPSASVILSVSLFCLSFFLFFCLSLSLFISLSLSVSLSLPFSLDRNPSFLHTLAQLRYANENKIMLTTVGGESRKYMCTSNEAAKKLAHYFKGAFL
jgi:hypothetical protein